MSCGLDHLKIKNFIYTVCVFLKHLKKEVVPKEVVPASNEVEGRRQCQNRLGRDGNKGNSDSDNDSDIHVEE